MLRTVVLYLLLPTVLLLSGCNVVYKQNIQQGNVLEAEEVEQLQAGMTKRQVLALLGSPAVENPFHANRWDYINSFSRRGRDPVLRRLTVEFENDQVSSFYGNYLEELDLADRTAETIDEALNERDLPPEQPEQNPVFPEPPG